MPDHKSILIVEDEPDFRAGVAAVLEGAGYRVVEAEDGEAALRSLRSAADFCLILLDLFMPVMNGWKFRKAQRADPQIASIPVVVISAAQDAGRHGAELGAIATISKPVDFSRLLDYVNRFC
jgi:CheY-like chemotaxis protein